MRQITPFKRLRFELGVRQLDVAARSGIALPRLSLIENGHVRAREDEWLRIASALGVSVDLLRPTAEAA